MEQLRDEVSRVLLSLENPELISTCQDLKCSVPSEGFEKQARRALIRLAEKTLDEVEDGEESSMAFQMYLQHVLARMKSLKQNEPSESETVPDKPSELDLLKEKYLKLQEQQKEARRLLEEEIVIMDQISILEGQTKESVPVVPVVDTKTAIMDI